MSEVTLWCGRCHHEIKLLDDRVVLANTDIMLCRDCERAWQLAPESKRLRAISASVFAEFIERERCEKLVAAQPAVAEGASHD
jgi:hypothetical protein